MFHKHLYEVKIVSIEKSIKSRIDKKILISSSKSSFDRKMLWKQMLDARRCITMTMNSKLWTLSKKKQQNGKKIILNWSKTDSMVECSIHPKLLFNNSGSCNFNVYLASQHTHIYRFNKSVLVNISSSSHIIYSIRIQLNSVGVVSVKFCLTDCERNIERKKKIVQF